MSATRPLWNVRRGPARKGRAGCARRRPRPKKPVPLLTPARVQALLRLAGLQRYVAARAGEIVEALHSPQLPARPGIDAAYTATTAALVAVILELNTQIGVLQGQMEESFGRHRTLRSNLSQPGLGPVLGAPVLGEFGDTADRYADARSRRNYAGKGPVTRASDAKRNVLARHTRNRRPADARIFRLSPYSARRPQRTPTSTPPAHSGLTPRVNKKPGQSRMLANRLVGILPGCLRRHHTTYNEDIPWHTTTQLLNCVPLDSLEPWGT